MNKQQASQLADKAIRNTKPGDHTYVADATYLIRNIDGTYSVTDNGEEDVCTTAQRARQFIIDNLTA